MRLTQLTSHALRHLRQHGLRATVNYAVTRLASARRDRLDARFDKKFGVCTSGDVELHQLGATGVVERDGYFYQPSPVAKVRAILRQVVLDLEPSTLVDFGSGKGRVLLLASEYPFRQVIGVEFSKELHDIAERNIAAYDPPRRQCDSVQSICADARDFAIPDGPIALYFYTPFTGAVMDHVLKNIVASLKQTPRPAVIAYYGADLDVVSKIEQLGWMKRRLKLPFDRTRPRTDQKMGLVFRYPIRERSPDRQSSVATRTGTLTDTVDTVQGQSGVTDPR